MRVGIDIDGVIYDWHYCIYRHFTESKGFTGTQREFWDYFNTLDSDTQDYYVRLPHLYLNINLRPEVQQALESIAEAAEIFYITAREEELKPATRKFLEIYKPPFKENLIFAKGKAEYVRLLGIKYFLDDSPRNVRDLTGITDVYLLTVPHNYKQRDEFKTVGSVREFAQIVRGNND